MIPFLKVFHVAGDVERLIEKWSDKTPLNETADIAEFIRDAAELVCDIAIEFSGGGQRETWRHIKDRIN